MKTFMTSGLLKAMAKIIGGLILALIIFTAGVSVGFHKARFSYQWGENYERNFAGPPHQGFFGFPPPPEFGDRGFRNAHGIAGDIISIADNSLVVKDRDNKENTIAITDKTILKRGHDDIKVSDLKNDDRVVILGRPGDNGAINADFIRVFDNNLPKPTN